MPDSSHRPTTTPSRPRLWVCRFTHDAAHAGTAHQARAALLIQHNPNTRQIDMVRCLGISKAYANELWHSLHPKGDQYGRGLVPAHPTETRIPDALHGWREIVESDNPASVAQMETIRQAICAHLQEDCAVPHVAFRLWSSVLPRGGPEFLPVGE